MLLRLAWRQSLIRLLLFYAVAIGLGFWLGEPWWALGLATAALAARLERACPEDEQRHCKRNRKQSAQRRACAQAPLNTP